jgi:hypothetical protein
MASTLSPFWRVFFLDRPRKPTLAKGYYLVNFWYCIKAVYLKRLAHETNSRAGMKFSPTRGNRGGVGENRVSTFEEGISEWNWSKKVMLFIF